MMLACKVSNRSCRHKVVDINNPVLVYELNADPNMNNAIFDKCISDLMNKYFPRKLLRFRKYKHKRSPWMTSGILKSIFYI